MICTEIYSSGGLITGFSTNGHSGAAERGSDIYCAGVSSLTQSAYLCLAKHLKREVDLEHASGKLIVKLKAPPDDLTEAVFQTMLLGLIEIEKLRPSASNVIIIDHEE